MTIAEQLESRGYEKGIHAGLEQGIEQGLEQGMQKGKTEGKAEGEYAARLSVARNMLSSHFDHDTIKKITGLSSSDLSKLVNNH